jgi:hypothetical protein
MCNSEIWNYDVGIFLCPDAIYWLVVGAKLFILI